ncbi:SDH family Clp fold serine proteinase [Idiomarina xiamenensis]|uniref:Serine dehydrogenase proteinase n=1 Tax=Idiomarina xiamenensis 10-D-4 TaxID=740709 RepID=K2KMA2_9GAMM|nr:hypothetical protein [Idiomarina xiamenensis]EKE87652.1 hypothetical protein A10D4_01120 [Idiomarina xiamenensis 10-D-4]
MVTPTFIAQQPLQKLQQALQQQRQQRSEQTLRGDSRVLLLAASQLSIELLPALHQALASLPVGDHLDVVIYSRGGVVNGVRRLALLLHEYAEKLTFIVPHYCESSATLLCLSGQQLIAGPLSIFSPIDPQLQAESAADGMPSSISAQDLRLFPEALSDWFQLADEDAVSFAVQQLAQSIFPTTLTSFYRANQEQQMIARQLLERSGSTLSKQQQHAIVEQLVQGYHSHSYAITDSELAALGLPVVRDTAIYSQALDIADQVRAHLGAGARSDAQQPWCDAIIASCTLQHSRWHQPDALQPQWQTLRADAAQ